MSSPARTTSAVPKKSNLPQDAAPDSVESPVAASPTGPESLGATSATDKPRVGESATARSHGKRRSGFAAGSDGTTLYYEVMGQRPPATTILLCDGVGCDGFVWKYLQWALAEHYRILHFHYRGHGRTPMPTDLSRLNQLTLSDFAADALAVLDACETERVVLCGHSMGVQVALETWHAAPERVAGLILICGSYGNPLRTFKGKETLAELLPLVRALVSKLPWLTGALWKRLIPTDLSYLLAQKLEINGDLIRREDFFPYLEGVARLDPRMFVSTLAAAGQHNAQELLPDIKVPTLILAGRHDSFTPMALSEKMHELIADSELHVVEQGSHTAPIERPAEITAKIEDFLQRRVPGSAAVPRP